MEQNVNPFATADAGWGPPSNQPEETPGPPETAERPESGADPLDFDPISLRARCDGWTPERQRAFIEELADCGIVREAAARVGMTEQSAGRLRRRADARAFSLVWEAALQIGSDRLRSIAFERAVNGVVKRRYYHGEVVGEERVFDTRLLIYLLGKSPPADNPVQVADVARDWDRWMQALEDGLDKPMLAPDENSRAPVWQSDDGAWWTNFPPPPGFNGDRHGEYGDQDYRRECTLDEVVEVKSARTREEGEHGRLRDLYFSPGKMRFPPHR